MLNTELANILIKKFGTESFKIYCILESERNKILAEEDETKNTEHDYDAKWWQMKYEQLMNEENH